MSNSNSTKFCSVDGCDSKHRTRGFCGMHYQRFLKHGDPLAGRAPNNAPIEFIHKAVQHEGDDCLLWPYGTFVTGYGKLRWEGKIWRSHRLVLFIVTGRNPKGMVAAHKPVICHNPLCVNPEHLRWATETENHADKLLDGTHNRGDRHGMNKLTKAQVRAIRDDTRVHRLIADDYGVCRDTVSDIKLRKTWAWLD